MARGMISRLSSYCRLGWRQVRRRIVRVFTQNAEPHMIALGAAIGIFAATLPFPFLQFILALVLATVLKANRLAAVTLVWVANPAFFYVDYVVGRALLRCLHVIAAEADAISWQGFLERFQQSVFALMAAVFVPTLVGSLVFGFVCAGATYAIALRVVLFYKGRAPQPGRW